MLELGKLQNLEIGREAETGMYLIDPSDDSQEEVLLPNKEVVDTMEIGDTLRVFLYQDFKDRLTATLRRPTIKLNEIQELEVIDVNETGAFLNWGLVKDLLLPFSEQKYKVECGDEVLVTLKKDDKQRLYASMRIYDNLEGTDKYEKDDWVTGVVYSKSKDLGVLVAIDNKYHGLILKNEIFQNVKIGEIVNARVTNVDHEGKINLSLRDRKEDQLDEDVKTILNELSFDGVLMYNDKSDPKEIKREFNMSKRAFKRAIGRLLSMDKIEFIKDGIKLKE
ncbi:MAG: CvfB family protein [Bacillota bacterium]